MIREITEYLKRDRGKYEQFVGSIVKYRRYADKSYLKSFYDHEHYKKIYKGKPNSRLDRKFKVIMNLMNLKSGERVIEIFARTIIEQANEVRQSPLFEQNKNIGEYHPDIRSHGKFTKEYNQLKSVRENRFRSIDEKIQGKDFSAMNIFKMSEETISRYNLALLCLPLVTSNGKTSRVNRVKGNDLAFLCGYNYKDASLDRYLRELKYLKVSDLLITATAKFWMDFWRNESEEETYFVCYYIDGNTKALWSSNRCYKGRVTILGRAMNCPKTCLSTMVRGIRSISRPFRDMLILASMH